MLKLYSFDDKQILADIINDKGKVLRYKEVHSISDSEESARIKSKLDEGYALVNVKELGKDWYA